MRLFTSLILDKTEAVRNEALTAFGRILDEHHLHFGELLWREILSQVLLPALADIR